MDCNLRRRLSFRSIFQPRITYGSRRALDESFGSNATRKPQGEGNGIVNLGDDSEEDENIIYVKIPDHTFKHDAIKKQNKKKWPGSRMGNAETKQTFRRAVDQMTSTPGVSNVDVGDASMWDQLCTESLASVQDVFALLPTAEIRALREDAPNKLATLCYKVVEKLLRAVDSSCRTQAEQQTVLNSCRLLTRLIPYIFEDPDWRGFFWSRVPESESGTGVESPPLAQSLMSAVSDLLFCPEFTVSSSRDKTRDEVDELSGLDSCELIWEKGVGFAQTPVQVNQHHHNRAELLRLIITCFSQTMYLAPTGEAHLSGNRWIQYFTSSDNRHALPLFTSLLNTVCGYHPEGILPYNHLIWSDSKERLVEVALQVLVVTLDQDTPVQPGLNDQSSIPDNLFLNYLSRIHRDEDFQFILNGITRLLMNPLAQTYLPHSQRKVQFYQELLIFFWKFCEHNRKFMFYVLKSSDVLEILAPILHHLNDARADQSRVGLMHIGVFILLLLSGERNFGVRLNKPYTATIPIDIPVFTGSHADLIIVVFHKIITTGHQRLQPLFDCLLTILCNISPYIKSMSMIASCKLLHLLEAFSTPWFLLSSPSNHHLVFFLLEMFNNIIQYQFDGNSNLVYTIIRKRSCFHSLANLPTDCGSISTTLKKRGKRDLGKQNSTAANGEASMEGSQPAQPAEPGTLKASLMTLPGIDSLTEQSTAHPSQKQLDRLTKSVEDPAPATSTCNVQPSLKEKKTRKTSITDKKASASSPIVSRAASLEDPGPSRPNLQRSLSCSSGGSIVVKPEAWLPSQEWVNSWKSKLPLQTIMRLLQVLVPQVEKICIDKGLTDESEILRFLQHGTLVGLLPVPHPILIRRYQANPGTAMWFRTYMWGVIYLRNTDPAIWYDTDVKLFQVQRI